MMKRKLARYVEAQQSNDLSALIPIIDKDLAEVANSKQTNYPLSNFESQSVNVTFLSKNNKIRNIYIYGFI